MSSFFMSERKRKDVGRKTPVAPRRTHLGCVPTVGELFVMLSCGDVGIQNRKMCVRIINDVLIRYFFSDTPRASKRCSLQFEWGKGLFQRKGYGNAAGAAKEIKHLLAGCHSVYFAQTCQTPYVCVIVDDKRAALIENKVAGCCCYP